MHLYPFYHDSHSYISECVNIPIKFQISCVNCAINTTCSIDDMPDWFFIFNISKYLRPKISPIRSKTPLVPHYFPNTLWHMSYSTFSTTPHNTRLYRDIIQPNTTSKYPYKVLNQFKLQTKSLPIFHLPNKAFSIHDPFAWKTRLLPTFYLFDFSFQNKLKIFLFSLV